MIRVLFFIIKLGLLVALAVWVADRSGSVTIEWKDKVIETSTLILALGVGLIAFISYYFARIVSAVSNLPYRYRMYRHLQLQRKGDRMLGEAVTALADERKDKALSFIHKAEKLLGRSQAVEFVRGVAGETPLVAEQGDYSSPFAWKEAIEGHLQAGRITEAKRLAEKFAAKHTKLALPRKMLFEVYVREENWDMALRMLDLMREDSAASRSELRNNRAAVLAERARLALERGQKEEAFQSARHADKLHPHWIPAILLSVKALAAQDKPREAASFIEKLWADVPHVQLGREYLALKTGKKDAEKAQAAENLARRAPLAPASQLLEIEALMRANLLAQARFKAKELAKTYPSRELFNLLAKIEAADHAPGSAQEWKARAAEAPLGEAWMCQSCRQPHSQWQACCTACHGFNTLQWQAQPSVISQQ